MSRWPDAPRKKTRIELVPMIDVMMFLLVFFVLISINVIPALGLKTKLPQSSQAKEEHPPLRVVVTLPETEGIQVDGESIDLSHLADKLVAKRSANDKEISIFINGDASVELQRLINVMDVIKSRGFDSVSIAARKH